MSHLKITANIEDIQNKVNEISARLDGISQNQDLLHIKLSTQITNNGILQISNNVVIKKLFNGLKIFLDPSDLAVAAHIALDGVWEQDITDVWLNLIEPDSVVFDIGANFGYFGLLAAHKTNKKTSKVRLFEANPQIIPYLERTFTLNWYHEHGKIENLAISSTSGKVELNVLKDYTGSSSLHSIDELSKYVGNKMKLELDRKVKVNSISIDEYCKANSISNVDLIKMDIEGHEEEAYKGMVSTVKESPNISLLIEFTKDSYSNPKEFYETLLKDFGYVFIIGPEGKLIKPKNSSYEEVIGNSDDWTMPVFSKNKNLDKR